MFKILTLLFVKFGKIMASAENDQYWHSNYFALDAS